MQRAVNRKTFLSKGNDSSIRKARVKVKDRKESRKKDFDSPVFEDGVVFESILDTCDGYGGSAETLAIALHESGVNVRYVPLKVRDRWESGADPRLRILVSKNNNRKKYLGYFAPTGDSFSSAKMQLGYERSIYTMFESTRPPRKWAERINVFNKFITPSSFCLRAFQNIGVKIPSYVVPIGINPPKWPLQTRSRNYPFRFLMYANADFDNPRKNYRVVFEAFRLAFANVRNVELVLKITSEDFPPDLYNLPNVRISSGRSNQMQLLSLLQECHCFVTPSKGEGYGLPAREAMATGLSVIAPNFGGMESVMSQSFNYPIPYTLEPADYSRYPDILIDNNGFNDFGDWARVSIGLLAQTMTCIVDEGFSVLESGFEAASWIRQHETSSHAVSLLRSILGV